MTKTALAVPNPDRLTPFDVETQTGVKESTLRYWRSRNEGPTSYRLGRRVYYRQADLDKWMADQYDGTARGTAMAECPNCRITPEHASVCAAHSYQILRG